MHSGVAFVSMVICCASLGQSAASCAVSCTPWHSCETGSRTVAPTLPRPVRRTMLSPRCCMHAMDFVGSPKITAGPVSSRTVCHKGSHRGAKLIAFSGQCNTCKCWHSASSWISVSFTSPCRRALSLRVCVARKPKLGILWNVCHLPSGPTQRCGPTEPARGLP